ncbi:MAG TPA: hypothetical protein VMA83_11270 [Solirubrobacteraceae bacterium]|nr:hypothetical protein [Solirubrobacteraceae bacterium]
MSAGRDYRLTVTRGGIAPALIADPERVDHVELVEVASGEVVFFWDCTPAQAITLAKAIRRDLQTLETGEFIARWSTVQA